MIRRRSTTPTGTTCEWDSESVDFVLICGFRLLQPSHGNPLIFPSIYSFHKEGIANGGNRYATVLTYLADTEEGGETVFPNIPAPGGKNDDSFSECARYHLAAKPKKGTAVLFHSIKPSGEVG